MKWPSNGSTNESLLTRSHHFTTCATHRHNATNRISGNFALSSRLNTQINSSAPVPHRVHYDERFR